MSLFSWLRCEHARLSVVFTIDKRSYRVCLRCGAELEYDLATMQLTGAHIVRPITRPDEVHIARMAKRRRGIERDQFAPERSITR